MKQHKLMGIGLAAMVALAGCTDTANMTEPEREVLRISSTLSEDFGGGPGFGNWRHANEAVQIIDPAPAYAQDPPVFDGAIIIGAFGRYRTDKVKPPEPIGTD